MLDSDPFLVFTWLIFVVLSIYYILSFLWLIREGWALLRGNDPHRRLLRLYVTYHLVTIDFRPLRSELWQIAALLASLLVLWRASVLLQT